MIINVSGRAERDVAPDLGVVQLTIGFSGNDKAVVLAKAHEKANWLAEQIEALPADELVKYSSDGVRNYSYTRQEKKVKQVIHEASCSFAVTFKDLAALSQRTAEWCQAEGISHDWTDWGLTDQRKTSILTELLGEALDVAKRKAVTIARHLGECDPQIVEVRENHDEMPRFRQAMLLGAASQDESSNIFEARPEDLHLSHSIGVTFKTES